MKIPSPNTVITSKLPKPVLSTHISCLSSSLPYPSAYFFAFACLTKISKLFCLKRNSEYFLLHVFLISIKGTVFHPVA